MPVFTVDTHLFRELGDLLVGRDSTALFELIKNAYDADATEVTVAGFRLDDPEAGEIIVTDNGCGMNETTFQEGFLRIASRTKDTGERRSATFHRRFTGSKGIGRLSAHKLAKLLQVLSVAGVPGGQATAGTWATIDWDAIEARPTLDDIGPGREVILRPELFDNPVSTGTRITLRRLRRRWTPQERTAFVAECQSSRPPQSLLADLVPRILHSPLLFARPIERERQREDRGFDLKLEGEFSTGESLWPSIMASSQWVIEVDASRARSEGEGAICFGIAHTVLARSETASWEPRIFTMPRSRGAAGPFFQARISVQVNPKAMPSERQNIRRESGVRVFVEGFRVLPYGEPGNDWLALDADYTRRSKLDFRDPIERLYGSAEDDEHWEELSLPNRSYFGGVFLTQEGAASLRPLINREGFLPDSSFEFLRYTIRLAVDLCTRVRAAASFHERSARREARRRRRGGAVPTEQQGGPASPPAGTSHPPLPPEPLQDTVNQVTTIFREARDLLAGGRAEEAKALLENMPQVVETLEDAAERVAEEGPMLRVLASVGTHMSAFVHEIRSLLGTAQAIEEAIERLRSSAPALPPEERRQLAAIQRAVTELRRNLERQASYLLDIATPDATRRRSRQPLAERFEAGVRLLRAAAERRNVSIENTIPLDLKSPPMFPAELTSVFSNLLSNAIKAAGRDGRILATGSQAGMRIIIRVENTGVRVNLAESERWFRPFESTTTQVDSLLGQGMGLGLTITRNMLEPYGATIRFVEPSEGYETALEIVFPD